MSLHEVMRNFLIFGIDHLQAETVQKSVSSLAHNQFKYNLTLAKESPTHLTPKHRPSHVTAEIDTLAPPDLIVCYHCESTLVSALLQFDECAHWLIYWLLLLDQEDP